MAMTRPVLTGYSALLIYVYSLETSSFQFDGFLLAKVLFTLCLCGGTHSEGGATGVTWGRGTQATETGS